VLVSSWVIRRPRRAFAYHLQEPSASLVLGHSLPILAGACTLQLPEGAASLGSVLPPSGGGGGGEKFNRRSRESFFSCRGHGIENNAAERQREHEEKCVV